MHVTITTFTIMALPFQHTLVTDTRDNRVLPSEGYLIKSTQEIAGLGGDVKYLKCEEDLQFNKSLFLDCVSKGDRVRM